MIILKKAKHLFLTILDLYHIFLIITMTESTLGFQKIHPTIGSIQDQVKIKKSGI